jgi:hypothetical protein
MSENVHNSLIKNYPDPCMVAFASNLRTREGYTGGWDFVASLHCTKKICLKKLNSWKTIPRQKLLRYNNPCGVCTHGMVLLSKRKEVFLETQRHCAWWQSKVQMIPLIQSDRKVCNFSKLRIVSKLCIVSKLQLTERNWVFARKQGPGHSKCTGVWGWALGCKKCPDTGCGGDSMPHTFT